MVVYYYTLVTYFRLNNLLLMDINLSTSVNCSVKSSIISSKSLFWKTCSIPPLLVEYDRHHVKASYVR
jgi:hypothetical protein